MKGKGKLVFKICLIVSLCVSAAALLILYAVISSGRASAQRAVDGFALPVRRGLGAFFGIFPFSVMELVYTLLGAGVIAWLVLLVRKLILEKGRLRTLARRVGALVLAGAYALCGYLWLWGIDYRAYSFSQREGLQVPGVTAEQLEATAEHFLRRASELAQEMPRDENGRFAADLEPCFAESTGLYGALEADFPSLEGKSQRPKKMLLYSEVMSRMGFTGVYFCFTGESNINMAQPAAFVPFTIAHELAHQRGVASESECNFLGVAASLNSGMPVYEYSGCLVGLVHLVNALSRADPEKSRALCAQIEGPLKTDWDENNAYWAAHHSSVTKVSKKAYDTFLKANGQKLGIESYGACVDLLVYFYENGLP